MDRLAQGWANGSWQASGAFLEQVARHTRAAEGPILECGSGASTIVAGAYAKHGVWSLEHLPEWCDRMQAIVCDDPRVDAHVVHAPLRSMGTYEWYDVPKGLPATFSLVICDGPPHTTRGGRYGLLPQMEARLAPGATVLLDDTHRVAEKETAERWSDEFDMRIESMDSFAVLRYG